ncbi:hypothetical protein J6590_076038 [Homalodisca vitripennis]|nr:hypothetical protein J6590_076038 [Homalodisca vitripennis]
MTRLRNAWTGRTGTGVGQEVDCMIRSGLSCLRDLNDLKRPHAVVKVLLPTGRKGRQCPVTSTPHSVINMLASNYSRSCDSDHFYSHHTTGESC